MNGNKKVVNGREIEYLEGLHTRVEIHFSFIDKMKILFGFMATVNVDVYLEEPKATVVATESSVHLPPFIKSKPMGMMSPYDDDDSLKSATLKAIELKKQRRRFKFLY